jgi:sugar transferase (PEP-CTERM/EpsH1 system associated)
MRILFVATQLPLPPNTGGRIRSLNIVKHLAQEHDVTFVCTVNVGTERSLLHDMQQVCQQFIAVSQRQYDSSSWRYYLKLLANLASPDPFGVAKDYSPTLVQQLRQLLTTQTFDVLVCDFLHASINLRGLHALPVVLFQHNVEAEIFRRYYLHATNPGVKMFWLYQWRKMQRYEGRVCREVDRCIAVSQTDKRTFENDYGLTNVATIDTGVDVSYFTHHTTTRVPRRLVFTGSMDWLPNEDAMLFFIREIFPHVAKVIPEISLVIVGRRPSSKLLQVCESIPQVVVTGGVPDVRPYLAEAEVFIVPLRIGGGTRIKIFEAMASGVPVVSTTVGAEGLVVEHQRHLLFADTAAEFVQAVITLCQNPTLAQRIATAAKTLVTENYDWKIVAQQFAEICHKTRDQRKVSSYAH